MKLEDLMLNDWVLHKGEPCKVVGINNRLYLERNERVFLASPQEVSPIPLTKLRLAKSGFEEQCDLFWYKDTFCTIKIDMSSYIVDGEEYNPICVILEGALFDINISIEYIHELQHALRLCGIEKEIVL